MKVGEQIKKQRQEMSLTQEEVAKTLHVTRQTISSWETGRSYPDIVMLIQLSDFFSISLDQLLREDSEMVEDIKKKTEIAENRKMYWGSWSVNFILLIILLFKMFHVPGFQLDLIFSIFIFLLVIFNASVLKTAQRKREELFPDKGNEKKSLKVGLVLFLAVVAFGCAFVPAFHQNQWHFLGVSAALLLGAGLFYRGTRKGK